MTQTTEIQPVNTDPAPGTPRTRGPRKVPAGTPTPATTQTASAANIPAPVATATAAPATASGAPVNSPGAYAAKAPKKNKRVSKPAPFDYIKLAADIADKSDDVHDFYIKDLDLSLVQRVRSRLDKAVVDDYASVVTATAARGDDMPFPPITVTITPEGKPLVLGGWHRTEAFKKAGAGVVPGAIVSFKNMKEAVRTAIADNRTHGAHMTRADKQASVMLALTDGGLGNKDAAKSDRSIAELVGCSPSTVGTFRKKLEEAGTLTPAEKRIGADGREINTAPIAEAVDPEARARQRVEQYVFTKPATDVATVLIALAKAPTVLRAVLAEMHRSDPEILATLVDMADRVLAGEEEPVGEGDPIPQTPVAEGVSAAA